jgi:hypothetical protein
MTAARITTRAALAPAMMGHFFLAALVLSNAVDGSAGGAPFEGGAENRTSSIAGAAA